jgi:hypothetical protein
MRVLVALVAVPPSPRRISQRGFALVVCLVLMILLVTLALGMLSLTAVELRRSTVENDRITARTNARLALAHAIGQLQKTLGPDQRVSATAEILGESPQQPHWTGVWRSTREDGSSFITRDDLAGGLSDARWPAEFTPAERVLEWLVSGADDPITGPGGDPVVMLREGDSNVMVSKIPVKRTDGAVRGHQAWWTGDLGVRAHIGARDPRDDVALSRGDPGGEAWFRIMASHEADTAMMAGDVRFHDDEIDRFASANSVPLASAGEGWSRMHAFDFTVDSMGVLADVAQGGLKHDLTAYLSSDGMIPDWKNLPGLRDEDLLVTVDSGDTTFRHGKSSPRFGLLRDWARPGVPFSGKDVPAKLPETGSADEASETHALANHTPVKLDGNQRAALQPILVEATNFTHISTFTVPGRKPPLYQLRYHHYPRVVLWNPYNVELEFDRAMIMIQGNGRQEMLTDNDYLDSEGRIIFSYEGEWLSFEGGRSTRFNASGKGIFNTEGYNDPYIGAYYFAIPKTRFAPGECLVFSPARNAEYDCLSPYRIGPYNLNANELSCEVAPDPSRSYYISGTDISGGIYYRPSAFWFAPTPYWSLSGRNGVENQGDDARAVLKHVGSQSSVVHFEDFDRLPQIAVASVSLQYGAGREPRISWSDQQKMPIELLDYENPQPTVIPNVRTREGVRLRWFQEHLSNLINSGPLTGTAHFEEALLGNWNPRAAFAVRSPWENVAGSLPKSGTAGGPWFFGAYTRDLFDQAVGWDDQTPVLSDGRYRGNPFGPPQEGMGSYVLFDVPRDETGVLSLGLLQHAKISEFIWHPSYAIGNSLADPRLGSGGYKGLRNTAPIATKESVANTGGFHEDQLGWSLDSQRGGSRNAWAVTARAILGDIPADDNLVHDLSFEVNQTLWDRYYLSSGSAAEKKAFLENPRENPLPNSRMRPTPAATAEDLTDFHRSASRLMLEGAFNVNSARVEAWKALLGSSRLSGYGSGSNVPFPRVLDPPQAGWKNSDDAGAEELWAGYRELTPPEIDALARAIVDEVKTRGPFISLADFVNRRLAEDETGRMGALQAAIEKAGLNSSLAAAYPLDNQTSLRDYDHPDNLPDATLMEQTLKPASTAWGAPGWLTQADILQVLGPVISARSDTFVIRAFGDAVDATGRTTATAWCEAIVQRTPEPVDPDESGLNPRLAGARGDFGRRFIIKSFRWLRPEEI